jgi:hypothetical protein
VGAVSTVLAGIQKEIDNVANVLNAALLNPFILVVPHVNPCLTNIFERANPISSISNYVAQQSTLNVTPEQTF